MARVPKIDLPCPLGAAEQRSIDDFCTRCSTQVHRLDGLDDAARCALLAAAKSPVCVSYRVARPLLRRAALGVAALGAGLGAGAALADKGVPAAGCEPTGGAAPFSGQPGLIQDEGADLDMVVFIGGVSRPDEAEWQDDSELADLPVSYEEEE
jgi:hypothetical protein